MPSTTPIYAFPFPCPGDTVSALDFTNLANAIDAKLADVGNDMTFALNRPNTDRDFSEPSQVIAPGVVTLLTLAGSTYTISVAGVWVVWVQVGPGTPPPTITYSRAQGLQTAVARFSFSQDAESNIAMICRPMGVIIAAAGDVITSNFLYTGTGTYSVNARLSAKLLCRIP